MKKNKIIFWTTTVFLFLFEGVMPLSTLIFAPSQATAGGRLSGLSSLLCLRINCIQSIRLNSINYARTSKTDQGMDVCRFCL